MPVAEGPGNAHGWSRGTVADHGSRDRVPNNTAAVAMPLVYGNHNLAAASHSESPDNSSRKTRKPGATRTQRQDDAFQDEPEDLPGERPWQAEEPVGRNTPWIITPYSYQIVLNSKRMVPIRKLRGSVQPSRYSIGDILHDLLATSFVPLTVHRVDPDQIERQAVEFLSSFSDNMDLIAVWKVDVSNIPYSQGQLLMGMTEHSRDEMVVWRFLRFRFPHVRFEWQIETPHIALSALTRKEKEVEIKVMWKAWAQYPVSSGLVAYGSCDDTLTVTKDNYPVIKKRIFYVTNIIHPELMTPVPYPNKVSQLSAEDDFKIFSTSQTMIRILQSSKERMALLVALSALVTSSKPIVDKFLNPAVGWVLTGVGIVAAATSILSVFAGWMLVWIDANSARHRQVRAA